MKQPLESQCDTLLDKSGLKKTTLRRRILATFLTTKTPLSQADLIQILVKRNFRVDRVSVYRNLAQLTDIGLIHELSFNQYVYCGHDCSDHGHLLMFCQNCQTHQEIKDHNKIESFMEALQEFHFFCDQNPIVLQGVCRSCSG